MSPGDDPREERAVRNTSHSWTDPRTSERWMVNADGVWRWAGGAWRFSGWRSPVSDQVLRLAAGTAMR